MKCNKFNEMIDILETNQTYPEETRMVGQFRTVSQIRKELERLDESGRIENYEDFMRLPEEDQLTIAAKMLTLMDLIPNFGVCSAYELVNKVGKFIYQKRIVSELRAA